MEGSTDTTACRLYAVFERMEDLNEIWFHGVTETPRQNPATAAKGMETSNSQRGNVIAFPRRVLLPV
jgi:hypothetical protein